MGKVESKDFVYLDSLDGFEFEKFCASIFERLGYGRVEDVPYVGDEGRDLIIHTPQRGKIVVECKHHPHGTIGRPIVQKLHSAVITEGAVKGILVTTGKFSEEAIAHTKKIRPEIELVDLNILRDLAERAGIHLAAADEKAPLSYYPISDGNEVGRILVSSLIQQILSHPQPFAELLQVYQSRLWLRPVYCVRYSVHQDFKTSVGIIHSIRIENDEVLLDGTNANPIEDQVKAFLLTAPTITGEMVAEPARYAERGLFKVDQTTLINRAKQIIANRHTKVVSYYGRNNVRYTTECHPGDRSILLRDVRQVFIPVWSLSLLALSKQYSVTLVEKHEAVMVLRSDLSNCKICGRQTSGEMLLCNSCGNITHRKSAHGYTCKICAKSLCRNCTHWVRRWLILKKYLCEQCASQKQILGKRTRHLVPELPQKFCINCGARIHADAVRCLKCWSMQ